ncbi:hypothetical protein M1L60_02005 [Actinoplanes sp. TRM 88003]|uniref:Uncharacterized protein n=1 Tax=Paractinoplanes aksuensis TaxID=2939490 RepID=A0ABT1DEW8_9ACTN|nr:hypothetical protein [Actinoplanes aksuensis]MCO8269359.1 hypothetical protein [Actinoplanes aksuensis]
MAVKDYTTKVAPAFDGLLPGGERLLAAAPLVQDPGTTEDVSARDELIDLLDPTILVGLGTFGGNAVQQAVWGRAVIGPPGTQGQLLHAAIGGVTAPAVAVTDRRLLIVEIDVVPRAQSGLGKWFGPSDQVARERYGVDKVAILGAVAAPAGALRRGRLLAGFRDGSGCMLVCAPPSLAPAVVEAIGAPREG